MIGRSGATVPTRMYGDVPKSKGAHRCRGLPLTRKHPDYLGNKSMSQWFLKITLAILVVGAVAGAAAAAEFQVLNRKTVRKEEICGVKMTGKIEEGDLSVFQRVVSTLSQYAQPDTNTNTFTFCLDSPGGNYRVGLSIAAYIIEHDVTTLLLPNAQCYSACALMFMAGGFKIEGHFVSHRSMHKSAQLGFHAPYLNADGGRLADAATVFASAIRAIRDLANLGKKYGAQEQVMPISLFAELLSTEPNEVFLVDTVFKAIQSNIRIIGVANPIITTEMLGNACINRYGTTGTPDLNSPPEAWSGSQYSVTRRSDQYWFSDFGGEGAYYCIAKFPLDSRDKRFGRVGRFALYESLVSQEWSNSLRNYGPPRRPLDSNSFFDEDNLYLYPPATLLRSIP
jgi:hypothetical protein